MFVLVSFSCCYSSLGSGAGQGHRCSIGESLYSRTYNRVSINQSNKSNLYWLHHPPPLFKGRYLQFNNIYVLISFIWFYLTFTNEMNSTEAAQPVLDWTGLKCLCVLQVGCNPLSDQDELHLNMLEKHVSSLFLCLFWSLMWKRNLATVADLLTTFFFNFI